MYSTQAHTIHLRPHAPALWDIQYASPEDSTKGCYRLRLKAPKAEGGPDPAALELGAQVRGYGAQHSRHYRLGLPRRGQSHPHQHERARGRSVFRRRPYCSNSARKGRAVGH